MTTHTLKASHRWPLLLGAGIGLLNFTPWQPFGFTTYFLPVVPKWYAEACIVTDVLVAAAVLVA
ncbi:hypothetical protein JOF56_010222 [Kibdelosporangium banguiense]|uniref:Uncharacterized protein n=1 Tax=Kibdelosporangium banguiense TaxID=1365924 RepID=A0ABS4TZK1_9PSEU|nr:hypothetical protein [Kibdelosporangium banguiense]MBP2329837.1 hypothetical protein [Kibdelosporangium banguiense]